MKRIKWVWPWNRRCKAKLSRYENLGGMYWGRCDLKRGHTGPHILERGMVEVKFEEVDRPEYLVDGRIDGTTEDHAD